MQTKLTKLHDHSLFLLLTHLFNHKKVRSSNPSSDFNSEACRKQIRACCGMASKDAYGYTRGDIQYILVEKSRRFGDSRLIGEQERGP